jgi:hypothetical protein
MSEYWKSTVNCLPIPSDVQILIHAVAKILVQALQDLHSRYEAREDES